MLTVGIDPGISGAMTIIYDIDSRCGICHMTFKDNLDDIIEFFRVFKAQIDIVYIEKVHSMHGQGVSTTWTFAENYGFWKGLITANGIPYKEIAPQTWKKRLQLSQDKEESIALAKSLYPQSDFKRTPRCKKEDHNICESTLLAHLALEDMKNEST